MQWFNMPAEWTASGDALAFTTGDQTDFWQVTHYDFIHDNGHLYGAPVDGGFTAEVIFDADYQAQYDQAGLMLRFSPTEWVKAGIEFAHGAYALSVVVTRGVSDWSVTPIEHDGAPLRLRMTRRGSALCVEWARAGGGSYRMLRLAAISDLPGGLVGPMACSPSRAGLKARFEGFRLAPPIDFSNAV